MQDFLGGLSGSPPVVESERAGDYTELQTGVQPTQQQVFTLPATSSIAFTEYFKPFRRNSSSTPLPADYADATAEVGRWWDSAEGVPSSRVASMEAFFAQLEDRPITSDELLSRGSEWGWLHERLTGKKLAPGAPFFPPAPPAPPAPTTARDGARNGARHDARHGVTGVPAEDLVGLWRELAENGTFSQQTLDSTRAPLSYAVDATWVARLEASATAHGATWLHRLLLGSTGCCLAPSAAAWLHRLLLGSTGCCLAPPAAAWLHRLLLGSTGCCLAPPAAAQHACSHYDTLSPTGATWLHRLLLSVAYAEAGELDRPRSHLEAALAQGGGAARCPIIPRILAVLKSDPEEAWPLMQQAWTLARQPGPPTETPETARRLRQNVADEMLHLVLGQLPGATTGELPISSPWANRLEALTAEAEAELLDSDTIRLARIILQVGQKTDDGYLAALRTLGAECFPTLGRGRDALLMLWKSAVVGKEAVAKGRVLTPVEAHRARKAMPVPRNLGCPYATLYCEEYW